MCVFMLYIGVTKFQRMGKFEQESEPLEVCAKLENKYITPGNIQHGGSRPPRKITVFIANDLSCKHYPTSTEWTELRVDQKYIIHGRATKTNCQLDKIVARC